MKRIVAVFGIVCMAVGSVHGQGFGGGQGCDPAPSGLVSWWPGNGNANDIIGGNNGSLVGGAGFAAGEVGQAFSFNGTSGYVTVPNSPSLDFSGGSITVEAWIKVNYLTNNADWKGIITKGNASWRLFGTVYSNTITFGGAGTSGTQVINGNRNVNDGNWHHVAAVYDGANMFLYVDGTLDASQPETGLITTTSDPVGIGYLQNSGLPGQYWFDGRIDEPSIYSRALSAGEIAAIYNAGAAGKCAALVAHVITSQPTNQTVQLGGTANFRVTASGTGPLSYLWSVNGSPVLGANKSTLTLTNVQLSQNGSYYSVQVSDAVGSTNSTAATLTVVTSSAVIAAPPAPPYGPTLSALSGGNPNGPWELFVQDEAVLDTGTNYNGWFLSLTLASPVGAAADNQIYMTSVATNVPSGSNIVYVLSVTNYGPSPSTNVQVSDTLPSSGTLVSSSATQGTVSGTTWNIGTLATNAGAQIALTVRPNSDGSYFNYAQVSASTPDPNSDDDTASATVSVGVPAQLQIGDGVAIGGGQFLFPVNGPPVLTVIEASTNLLDWVPVYTNTPPFVFTNIISGPFPNDFYRAVQGL